MNKKNPNLSCTLKEILTTGHVYSFYNHNTPIQGGMLSSQKMIVKRKPCKKVSDSKKSSSENKLKTYINIITTVEKNPLTGETKLLNLSTNYL